MKRRDLIKALADQAKTEDTDLITTEGGSHTKVQIGEKRSATPRSRSVRNGQWFPRHNEITAKAILRQMGVEQ
jgi:hypothetical protein